MEPKTNIKDAADAVKGIVEAVPVYEDLLQPATQEIGKGLHTVSKLVHVALAPVSAMVWGYEQIADYLQASMEEKLKDVPPENIIEPDISIAGPIIESMRFTGNKEELRDMFTNLLATSMNKEESSDAHPAYVEIIRQLSSDEAKILKYIKTDFFPLLSVYYNGNQRFKKSPIFLNFTDIGEKSGCEHPIKIVSYLDNLKRLGLIELQGDMILADDTSYTPLINHEIIQYHHKIASSLGKPMYGKSAGKVTVFGQIFFHICIEE